MSSAVLLTAALAPVVALLVGVGIGLRIGLGDRRLLEHELATAQANVARAQHFAQTGQPDRVLAVLAGAAARGAGDPGVLLDAVLSEPVPTSGTATLDPPGRPGEVVDDGDDLDAA